MSEIDKYPNRRIAAAAVTVAVGLGIMFDGLRAHPTPPDAIPDFLHDPRSASASTAEATTGNLIALAGILVPMADIARRERKSKEKPTSGLRLIK